MTEYELSVSLENGTPRTPVAADSADGFDGEYYCCAPPRPHHARMKLGDDSDDEGDEGDEGDGEGECDSVESISPRVLFPEVDVRRRLDFSSLSLSPIIPRSPPLPPTTMTMTTTERILVCDDDCSSACCSVGECGVCYMTLPLRANHIFTMCGHLFCVRCVLKWWDTATTCPICREELFQHEAVPPAVPPAVVEAADVADVAADAAVVEAVAEAADMDAEREPTYDDIINRVMREWRNSSYISSDSDSESDSAIDLT